MPFFSSDSPNVYPVGMATSRDLQLLEFTTSEVAVVQLDINHLDPYHLGPFCRLDVMTSADESPGVYAWVVDTEVKYIGKSDNLLHVVKGVKYARAYNDYTYIPPSKALQSSSPRVRVNGLLNQALKDGHSASWWWLRISPPLNPSQIESELISAWNPPWNLVHPKLNGRRINK